MANTRNGLDYSTANKNPKEILQDRSHETKCDKIIKPTNCKYDDLEIAQALKTQKRQWFLEQRRRQQLRENTEELRILEAKLRAAYINKGLAAQKEEKKRFLDKEKLKLQEERVFLENARTSYQEYQIEKEREDTQKKLEFKNELRKQMELQKQQRAIIMQERLQDQKELDQLLEKLKQEKIEEELAKKDKINKFKKDTEEFMKIRHYLKSTEMTGTEEQDRANEAYIKQRDEMIERQKQKRLDKLKEKEKISEFIGNKLAEEINEKRRKMSILEDLLIAEKEALNEEHEKRMIDEQNKRSILVQKELRILIEDNKKREQEKAREDIEFRLTMADELEKIEEQERMREEKQKQRRMKYRKDILDELDRRVQLRAEDLTILLKQREEEIRESQKRQQMVEKERIHMLQEHAAALQGFFPHSVLKESDREYLSLPPAKEN